MSIYELNKTAWDRAVGDGTNPYTKVVSSELVAEARQGKWSLSLSAHKPVPKDWFPNLRSLKVLCLASGGGQQAPDLCCPWRRSYLTGCVTEATCTRMNLLPNGII